ncbi:MAG: hypothetical protein ACFB10_19495 [Salibacteraceae bacterium]
MALVHHPDYWGAGKILYEKMTEKAFNELKLDAIQVLFPPTKTHVQGLLRLGFKKTGVVKIGEEQFIRYVLNWPE